MVSTTAYAAIAIAIIIPIAIFAVYSTTLEPEIMEPSTVEPEIMEPSTVEPEIMEPSTIEVEPKIFVLSSFYPIEQFTSQVGGDKIRSELVLPPGAEPHDWEPTIIDVENMKNADAIVINGIGFETWIEDVEDVGFEGIIIDTSEGIEIIMPEDEEHGDEHEEHGDEHEEHGDEHEEHGDEHEEHGDEHEEHGDEHEEHGDEHEEHGDEHEEHGDEHEEHGDEHEEHGDEHEEHGDEHEEHGDEGRDDDHHHHHDHSLGDPHIWLNPNHAQIQIQNIADGLSQIDPKNAEYYQNNADEYIEELKLLDSDIRMTLESCSKEFIAFHKAFTYFEVEYDLVQYTVIKSLTPHGEVSTRTLQEIVDIAREHNIRTVFTEEAADPRITQVIADEINGKVLTLTPLEIGQPGETYISSMYKNLNNLEMALCNDQ